MKATTLVAAFLGGAIAGAAAALLFAPEKGEDLRAQIKSLLMKYGVCKCSRKKEFEQLVDDIAEEIQEAKS